MTKTIAVDAVIVVVQTPVRDVMKTTKNKMRLNIQKNPSVFVFVVIEMWEEVGGVRSVCVWGGKVVGTADYIIVVRGS